MDRDLALKKILHYCNYQERCLKEIKTKLDFLEISSSDKDFILHFLTEEGFVDDERYCRSYVKSKINIKKWGVNKIKVSLIQKGIDKEIIDKVLSEVDEDLFKDELVIILKNKKIKDDDKQMRKAKLIRYALSKGYLYSQIMDALKHIEV